LQEITNIEITSYCKRIRHNREEWLGFNLS
jgi:hypothetical protein